MTRKKTVIPTDEKSLADSLTPAMIPAPFTERPVDIGDVVHYVMHDGVTIRPAMIVSYELTKSPWGCKANLQVLVDGANDDVTVRGQFAMSTLQDWRTDVPFDPGEIDRDYPELPPMYLANTWHFKP